MQFSDETKEKIDELCRRNKVRELRIFGSRARGDNGPESDYDLLVDFTPDSGVSLLEFSRMQIDLQALLGNKVDLVPKNGLKPRIRESVLSEAQLIYAE